MMKSDQERRLLSKKKKKKNSTIGQWVSKNTKAWPLTQPLM